MKLNLKNFKLFKYILQIFIKKFFKIFFKDPDTVFVEIALKLILLYILLNISNMLQLQDQFFLYQRDSEQQYYLLN